MIAQGRRTRITGGLSTCDHVWQTARREWRVETPMGVVIVREGDHDALDGGYAHGHDDARSMWLLYRCPLCDARKAVEVER